MAGVAGRADLLRRLGRTVVAAPEVFGRNDTPRPGGLFDHLAALAQGGKIAAPVILSELLTHLGPIWPSRLTLGGIALGDCWRHPSIKTADETSGLVPLHKLSQWLAYSLIEPLQWAGIEVTDIDGLTGLAEYRNGGLFIDTGVLALRDPGAAAREHTVDSELVVEWRALTVALLDRLADIVRATAEDGSRDAAACENPARRHLDGRAHHREAIAARRRPAAEDRQRRHGVLRGKAMEGVTIVDHPLVQHKLTLIAGQEPLDKILPRALPASSASCFATR